MSLIEIVIIGLSIGFLIGYSMGLLVGYGMVMIISKRLR